MLDKINFLISFAYMTRGIQELIEALCPYINVYLDCGAFTYHKTQRRAMITGKPANVKTLAEYVDYLRDYAWCYAHYIARDEIGNEKQTDKNLQIMLDAGLRPVPVLTIQMKSEKALELIEVNPYICVAGGVTEKQSWISGRVGKIYRDSNGKAKMHCLGYARYPGVLQIRGLYSCDSSSGVSGNQYGVYKWFKASHGFIGAHWSELGTKSRFDDIVIALRRSAIEKERVLEGMTMPALARPLLFMGLRASLEFARTVKRLRGINYYSAIGGFLPSLICAASGSNEGRFDYELFYERIMRYRSLAKAKLKEAAIDVLIDVIKEETRWEQEPV